MRVEHEQIIWLLLLEQINTERFQMRHTRARCIRGWIHGLCCIELDSDDSVRKVIENILGLECIDFSLRNSCLLLYECCEFDSAFVSSGVLGHIKECRLIVYVFIQVDVSSHLQIDWSHGLISVSCNHILRSIRCEQLDGFVSLHNDAWLLLFIKAHILSGDQAG